MTRTASLTVISRISITGPSSLHTPSPLLSPKDSARRPRHRIGVFCDVIVRNRVLVFFGGWGLGGGVPSFRLSASRPINEPSKKVFKNEQQRVRRRCISASMRLVMCRHLIRPDIGCLTLSANIHGRRQLKNLPLGLASGNEFPFYRPSSQWAPFGRPKNVDIFPSAGNPHADTMLIHSSVDRPPGGNEYRQRGTQSGHQQMK